MNILSVNKYYYLKGGAETYFFSLNKVLQEKGYEVTPFAMNDTKNYSTPYEKYFVDHIDYYDKSLLNRVKYSAKLIYSMEAKKKIERLIQKSKPDIAHLHNFYHQISPSILKRLKKYKVPIVFTAHDLKLICPNYQMLCKSEVCEKCKTGRFYQCTVTRCMKDSLSASIVCTAEMYLHRLLKSFDNIDVIVTPSAFYKRKFIEFGYAPEKIVHVPNFIDTDVYAPNYSNNGYIAYVGRLVREKGILTLVNAMKNIKNADLYIIGDGPLRNEIEKRIIDWDLSNIKLLGFKKGKELEALIQNCNFTVLPSEWYENSPLSVLESMAYGKAVVGSDIGGISELIEHEKTGLIFEAKNSQMLSEQIRFLLENPDKTIEMGKNARKKAEEEYCKEKHLDKIEKIYKGLLKGD